MHIIIFEEEGEIQDQYPLTLNRDRDRLQKYMSHRELPLTKRKHRFVYAYDERKKA